VLFAGVCIDSSYDHCIQNPEILGSHLVLGHGVHHTQQTHVFGLTTQETIHHLFGRKGFASQLTPYVFIIMVIKYKTMTHRGQRALQVFKQTETKKMERNWNMEVDKLKEQVEFLKLDAGKHKVVFLDNGVDRNAFFDEKEYAKTDFKVQHNGKEQVYVFSVTKGDNPTPRSLWGQLALYGKEQGTLVGKEITILVKGEGKSKDYTVLESAELSK